MTTQTQNTPAMKAGIPIEIQNHIADLVPDMRPIVDRIENGRLAGTTQFNYGGYLSTLSTLCPAPIDSRMLFIVCNALIDAGGDANGIRAAAAIMTGRDPLQAILI